MITFKNVSFGYEGQRVVSDLDFSVEEGCYLCIVGENGSGKSTLIKGILGITPPMSGSLSVNIKKSEIGYLPQTGISQKNFPASVKEVVMSGFCGRLGKGFFYKASLKAKATEIMNNMNITELAEKSISELSGGQQQRVLLARALAAGSRLLIMDEPASSLDPIAASQLYSLIEQINKSGISVIMVSHDIKSAVKYATHILHLGNKQLFFGETSEYIKSPYSSFLEGGGAVE